MCFNPIFMKSSIFPCGKCVDCKNNRAIEWSFRVMLEAKKYKNNCFITLTYNELNCPKKVSRRDFQLFIKRLRKYIEPLKIRYFGCGEYGLSDSGTHRPHYHIVIFGYDFPDKVVFKRDKRHNLIYRSAILEKLWTFGYSSIGDLTLESARYCAKYMQKTIDSDNSSFLAMSTHPGIGLESFDLKSLDTDKIYFGGRYIRIPRYFLDKVAESGFSEFVDALKVKRYNNRFKSFISSDYFDGRLYLEEVMKRKQNFFSRFGL